MARRNTQTQQRRSSGLDWILLILLIPGLIGALSMGAKRLHQETSNRQVELILDYNELQNLSASSHQSVDVILKRFKDAGVTGVAITEETLGDFVRNGQINIASYGSSSSLNIQDEKLRTRIWQALIDRKIGVMHFSISGPPNIKRSLPSTFNTSASPSTLNLIGIGLSDYSVKQVQASGLDVVARLQNYPSISKKGIDASFADLEKQHITRLISAGDEVYGYQGLIPYVADKIKAYKMTYGSIEFGKQKGDAKMCEKLKADYIRVHSISGAEMASLAPSSAVERFTRAVKERNIRLCYIHLPSTVGEDPVGDGVDFIAQIKNGIATVGYKPGIAKSFGEIPNPPIALALIALSIAAGTVMLISSVVSISSILKYGLLLIGFGGCAVFAVHGGKTKELVALLSAVVFPTLGVSLLIAPHFKQVVDDKKPGFKAALLFLGSSAFSIYGGLMVMGLLAQRSYMVHLDQFVGVKLAHLLPILAVAFMMAAGLPVLGKPFHQVRKEVSANLRKLLANPLFVWHVLAVFVVLAVLGVALMRTGNDPGMGVSTLELKFRAIMDHIMVVRPRTKEFLIGDPALILGIAFLLTRRKAWGLPLVALGVIGQVSMLNSLCHIHTPLYVTILHEVNGLWLGLLFGLIAWQLFGKQRRSVSNKE